MPYNQVQFLGFYADVSSIGGGFTTATGRYSGSTDINKDIHKRCRIMRNAMSTALSLSNRSNNVLKIFMAPEFFFRDVNGAYPVEKISAIAEKLRDKSKRNEFQDWLFVFGSALGYLPSGGNTREAFNVVLVQKGGVAHADGIHDRLVYKEYVSHIDFLRGGGADWANAATRLASIGGGVHQVRPTEGSRDLGSLAVAPHTREHQSSPYGGGSVFTMDNITFGLEVCLDHAKKRIKNATKAPGSRKPQLQLIPSAGMSITVPSIEVVNNGLVFNVDGLRPLVGGTPAVDVVKKTGGAYVRQNSQADSTVSQGTWDWMTVTRSKYFQNAGNFRVRAFSPQNIPPAETY
jgi:hypothetical protein